MRIAPTLLRLILALSLLLNGTGLAAAHAGDADAHATASTRVHHAPIDEAPCHEAPDPSGTGHGSQDGKAEGDVAKAWMIGHQTETDIDCCDQGTCDNACPHPLSAALIAAGMVGLHARPASLPQAMPGNRSGPLLSHPIRPPIA